VKANVALRSCVDRRLDDGPHRGTWDASVLAHGASDNELMHKYQTPPILSLLSTSSTRSKSPRSIKLRRVTRPQGPPPIISTDFGVGNDGMKIRCEALASAPGPPAGRH
jgi:hypothetical protein